MEEALYWTAGMCLFCCLNVDQGAKPAPRRRLGRTDLIEGYSSRRQPEGCGRPDQLALG